MSIENSIKRGIEIKNQSNLAKPNPSSTRQTINLGKGVPNKYEFNRFGRPTYEGTVSDTIIGEVLND